MIPLQHLLVVLFFVPALPTIELNCSTNLTTNSAYDEPYNSIKKAGFKQVYKMTQYEQRRLTDRSFEPFWPTRSEPTKRKLIKPFLSFLPQLMNAELLRSANKKMFKLNALTNYTEHLLELQATNSKSLDEMVKQLKLETVGVGSTENARINQIKYHYEVDGNIDVPGYSSTADFLGR